LPRETALWGSGNWQRVAWVMSLFAGSFAIGHFFLQPPASADAEEATPNSEPLQKVKLPASEPVEGQPSRQKRQRSPLNPQRRSLPVRSRARMLTAKGRMYWTPGRLGWQTHVIPIRKNRQERGHATYFLHARTQRRVLLRFPFIAEEPKAMGPILGPKEMKEQRKKQWGATGSSRSPGPSAALIH